MPEQAKGTSMARLLTVTGGLALVAVLLAGCGGGGADNGAKVESSLRAYFGSVNPAETAFPQGAGVVPRVRTNSCKHLHPRIGHYSPPPNVRKRVVPLRERVRTDGAWLCVVRFGKLAMDVGVLVDDSYKVVLAMPQLRGSPRPPRLPPPRTYTG